MKVADLMNKHTVVVYKGDNVQKAAEIMAEEQKGFLAVLDNSEEKNVVGVLSNTDIINRVMAKKIMPDSISVGEVMTKNHINIQSDATTSEAMQLMRKNNIKRVLVIDKGILQGVISSNDLLDKMIQHKKQLLDLAIDF